MIPRNKRPPTAGNGEGPESAATVNRCNPNSSTTTWLKRDRFAGWAVVREGVTE